MMLDETRLMFIFDMANNHMGSAEHGLRIVREFGDAVRGLPFTFAFKMQYRQLDTFIHPDFRDRMDIQYVKRFSETRLAPEDLLAIKEEMAAQGFVTVCTPFDEGSVDRIEEHGFDIIKVASCSFTDWPLLERIAAADKPIVASTGGATLAEIDQVVSFLTHRGKRFSLMHCVAEYPTEMASLQIGQIRLLRERYPEVRIGFSTHERPDNTVAVGMAVAAGARILEKHVGVPTDEWPLNAYSATAAQARAWIEAAAEAQAACGVIGERHTPSEKEMGSLIALRRGVFASQDIPAGGAVTLDGVFLAIPTTDGQLTANDMSKYAEFTAKRDFRAREAVLAPDVEYANTREQAYAIVQRVKEYLAQTGMQVPGRLQLEISHHYGIERFDEYGAVLVTFINREYCKKLIVVLPGQKHPEQYHEAKEETFNVLHGSIDLVLDGVPHHLEAGDIVTVERGVRHEFSTSEGAIIEEVSSTHAGADSFYTDPAVSANPNRKTVVSHWLE